MNGVKTEDDENDLVDDLDYDDKFCEQWKNSSSSS